MTDYRFQTTFKNYSNPKLRQNLYLSVPDKLLGWP